MTSACCRYSDWKAPAEDGRILIWPQPADLEVQTRRNQRLLDGGDVRVQNLPLCELRRQARRDLGHAVDRPLVATGHQTELYHPGVWAKIALVGALSRRMDAVAYHFAVDTDSPKHLELRWPGASHPLVEAGEVAAAPWSGLLSAPSAQRLGAIESAVRDMERMWGFAATAGRFLCEFGREIQAAATLSTAITEAAHRVDESLELRYRATIASPLWSSRTYLAMAYHILSRADVFGAQYNAGMAAYRREHGLKNAVRPWPDLQVTGDECEVPFWLDCAPQRRRGRAGVRRIRDRWVLTDEPGRELALDPSRPAMEAAADLARFLRAGDLVLSPRALPLTMFLRLFVCDQFVHGIGGGRYDQVTDRVIEAHLGFGPPSFSVTTATLYFPAAVGQSRVDLRPLLEEGRRLRHAWGSAAKRRLVRAIDAAPRHSPERQRLYGQLHAEIPGWVSPASMDDWRHRLERARAEADSQRELFDRELFYAIQPADRLRMVVEAYEKQVQP